MNRVVTCVCEGELSMALKEQGRGEHMVQGRVRTGDKY